LSQHQQQSYHLYSQDQNHFSGTDQLTADEITIGGNVKGIDFIIGKQTAPFGVYETAMISDPTGSDIGDILFHIIPFMLLKKMPQ
jgi:hypothetical protein